MAEWWEAAPLAETRATDFSAQRKPQADDAWWQAAPLAQEATSTSGAKRVTIDTGAIGKTQPAGNDRGSLDAAARGAAQGLTANFSDEIRGLVEASGVNPNDPASLSALISGALKYWSGDAEAKKRYEAGAARERDANKQAEDQHPYASLAGNVAGAVALPIGAASNAATLPGRMAIGGGVGAALGSAAGAGEGQGGIDTAARTLTGAAGGAVLGAAGPAVIEGAIRGARAIGTPIANAVRGVRDTESEAARRAATAIQRDINIDPQATNRLTPQEFAASVQNGGPAALIDLGGDTTRALARSAANTSPEGRAALNRTIDPRYEGQAPRVAEWLNKSFNYPDAPALQSAIESAAKNANRPAYANAYAKGQAIYDATLDDLVQAPVMQQAIRLASVTGQNKAALNGFQPVRNPFSFNRESGRTELKDGVLPNLQFWDHVKRNLDELGPEGRSFSKALRGHLDQIVPEYQTARAGAARFFGAEDALEAGQKFVTSRMNNREARIAFAELSPAEEKIFQDGFLSKFVDSLKETGDRRSILNKIADSPAARERLEMVLGPQKARDLEATMRVEGIMDLARSAVQGNSTTARQLAELGLAGGTYGISTGGNVLDPNPTALMNAAIVYGAARGKNAINERLARRVAEMLASNDPRVLLQGIQTVARNQNLFNSLRAADRGLARIGGEQSSGIPTITAIGAGRANDQPETQRPTGQR